jgi:hypothetical protein
MHRSVDADESVYKGHERAGLNVKRARSPEKKRPPDGSIIAIRHRATCGQRGYVAYTGVRTF